MRFLVADTQLYARLCPSIGPSVGLSVCPSFRGDRVERRENTHFDTEAASLCVNKAGYTATPVACGWAGAIIEVTRSFGQEQ